MCRQAALVTTALKKLAAVVLFRPVTMFSTKNFRHAGRLPTEQNK
jgi:hypothetical protein